MRYSGILRIGFKLLVNDRGKFFALLIGITFAVFLMMEMTAMFAGILNRAYSPITNIGAAMWIMDPAVNTATSPIPMPGYTFPFQTGNLILLRLSIPASLGQFPRIAYGFGRLSVAVLLVKGLLSQRRDSSHLATRTDAWASPYRVCRPLPGLFLRRKAR